MALTEVSTDGVKDDAITSGKIPANAVGSSELADNAVDTAAIADDAVTAAKLASGVQTTINNNADNRVITGSGTANTLNGESGLTFSGSVLTNTNTSANPQIKLISAADGMSEFHFGDANDATRANILYRSGSSGDALCFNGYNNTERMRIDSSGHVGIGMTPSGVRLDVTSTVNDIARFSGPNSGGITIRNDTSNEVQIHAGTSDALIFGTNGENERMRILSGGNVCINTTTTVGLGGPRLSLAFDGSANWLVNSNDTAGQSGGRHYVFHSNGSEVGSIQTTTSATSYNTSSDYRLKQNVTAISDGITRLKTLKPYRFNFKADASTTVDGFFAHEVTAVPEAISGTKDEVDSDNNPIYQGIDQSKLVPLLTAALQEAVSKIEVLETKVAALEAA